MRIRVTATDGARISFSCDLGHAVATWDGPPPRAGDTYDVELATDATPAWATPRLHALATGTPALRSDGDLVVIHARLESADADGVVFLRLAPDALLMLATHGTPPPPGTLVHVALDDLRLYDVRT